MKSGDCGKPVQPIIDAHSDLILEAKEYCKQKGISRFVFFLYEESDEAPEVAIFDRDSAHAAENFSGLRKRLIEHNIDPGIYDEALRWELGPGEYVLFVMGFGYYRAVKMRSVAPVVIAVNAKGSKGLN